MFKCLWNLCRKSDNIWVKWIHMIYLKGHDVMNAHVIKNSSWIVRRILELRDHVQDFQILWDRMITQGKFRMSVVYNALTSRDHPVEWRVLFCRNVARHRVTFTTWLICHGRLVTKNILKRFKVISDSMCSFCHTEEESIAHLFFACRYTYEIWKQVLEWINVNHMPKPWNEELNWIMKYAAKKEWKARLMKLTFTETLYGIWIRRNDVVFGHNIHTDIMYNIIDCIAYRGWQHKKLVI